MTATQANSLVRLINDYESIKERHAIVVGRLTEAEEIIWKYGDMINQCDNLRLQCEERLEQNQKKIYDLEQKNKRKTKLLRTSIVVNGVFLSIITIFITS